MKVRTAHINGTTLFVNVKNLFVNGRILFSNGKGYAYASFLIKIIPSNAIRPDFLVRILNSSDARSQMFAKAKSSSGIHNINSKELGSIILMLPEQWEQEQVVRIIDDLLAKEDAVKEAADTTLATIDTMKQSILSRAFRGELGTNDPNDKPAEELLKRILLDQL